MNLSYNFMTALSNKLKLKDSLTEKLYTENLLNEAYLLNKTGNSNYKNFILEKTDLVSKAGILESLLIMYIINISFSKTNTTVHVSDTKGNTRLFYSSGSVRLTGKQKKKHRVAVTKLLILLVKKATFLKHKPVALHFKNVTYDKGIIVKKLKQKLYIRVIKSFNQTPYNGCRKKKFRRKKYAKKFK